MLDILNGRVVRALRGRRKEYRPLTSVLCSSSTPLDVAIAFRKCGFTELYIADLDAITGKRANLSTLKRVASITGLELMVDAGISSQEMAERVMNSQVSKIIVGTETLLNLGFVKEAIRIFGNDCVIVSLDLVEKKILSRIESIKAKNPTVFSTELQEMGLTQIIILDLARVGGGEGVDLLFLEELMQNLNMDIFVGGGVRDINELQELRDIGVSGVLLASALHSGKISIEEIEEAGLFH